MPPATPEQPVPAPVTRRFATVQELSADLDSTVSMVAKLEAQIAGGSAAVQADTADDLASLWEGIAARASVLAKLARRRAGKATASTAAIRAA